MALSCTSVPETRSTSTTQLSVSALREKFSTRYPPTHRSVSFFRQTAHFCALSQMGSSIVGEYLPGHCPLTTTLRLGILFFSLRILGCTEAVLLTLESFARSVARKPGMLRESCGRRHQTKDY